MSDETVVETDGVSVSKFFNAEDFPVPAVAFEVASSREESVTLSIVDEIPDEFGIDQIGFHPEYGSEHWTASGDGVVRFERELDPGESFTTVYGVRMEEGQDETPFLSAPVVELQGENIDEVVPPESTEVVRELAGGERDTVPGLEDEAELEAEVGAGAEDSDVESLPDDDAEILEGDLDLGEAGDEPGLSTDAEAGAGDDQHEIENDEPEQTEGIDAEDGTDVDTDTDADSDVDIDGKPESAAEPVTEPEAEGFGADQPDASADEAGIEDPETAGLHGDEDEGSADAGAASETAETAQFQAGDLVGALADAIRNDEVSDEDLETLQAAFGGVPNSTQVEIEHLQTRVSELEAYSDALEAFIDDEGTAEQLVTDIENEVAGLSTELSELGDELAEVETSVEDAAGDREALEERVAGVEANAAVVDELEETVERVRGDLDALDERVEDAEEAVLDVDELEDDLDDLEDDLEDVEDHVDEIEQWRSQLSDVFGT